MLFFIISAVINAITSISLGIFVYFQNPRKKLNLYFSLFAISVALWSMGYFAWQTAKDAETAVIWLRVLMAGAVFIPVSYFHFVVTLVELSRRLRTLLIGGYVFAFVFVPLTLFTDSVVNDVAPKLWFPFWPQPGILFHIFLFVFFAYAIYSWYLLIQAIRSTTDQNKKNQILYVFWGTLIGFLGGSTNYFLWYDISIPPIGNLAVAIYVAMIGLAILKTQLFDIRVILTQILTGVISVLLFINLLLSETMFEYFWKGGLLFAFLAAGYLLVKSVVNEIRQREELEKLSKAKSEFMSIASHQLRTPLSVIKGYASLLEEGSFGAVTEKQKEVLGKVFKTNEDMINMVNDLLDVTRAEEGRLQYSFERTDLRELIKIAAKAFELATKQKGLTLEYQLPVEPVSVNVDKDKITQVFSNLIDNAIKYTEKGGIKIDFSIDGQSNVVRVLVADTGPGIGEEEMKHLFGSFSRGKAGIKSWTKGTGMGLYIAKQFVEAHKGKIWATSEGEGKGSTFFVELPVT